MKIAVVTDSGSTIYHEGLEIKGLFKLPLQITDGFTNWLEGETITIDETYQMISDKKILKSSMPPIGRIETLFETLKQDYDHIFAVPISSGLSGTMAAMESAAYMVQIGFTAFECYSTALNQLHLAMSARTLFDQGKSISEVINALQKAVDDSVTFVIADDLRHLARNGRTTPLAATIGGFLKIKPVMIVDQKSKGRIDIFEKTRTMHKAWESIIELFIDRKVDEHHIIGLYHVWANDAALEFKAMLEKAFPKTEITFGNLISCVGVNTGLGCIAIQYIRKVEI